MEEEEEELFEEISQKLAFLRQLKCCSGAFILSFVEGVSRKVPLHIPTDPMFQKLVHPTIFEYSNIALIIASITTVSFSTHFLGRKKSLVGIPLLNLVPLLVTAASENKIVLYSCALAIRFSQHALILLLTLYVSEVSQARFRAFFIGIYWVASYLGSATIRYLSLSANKKTVALLSVLLELAAFDLSLAAPETPHYLTMTDRADQAEQVMRRLWADTEDYEAEALLEKAEQYSEERREGIFSTLMSSRFATPLFLCFSFSLANYHICGQFYERTNQAAVSAGYNHTFQELQNTKVYANVNLKFFIIDLFEILGSSIYLGLCLLFARRTMFAVSLLSSLTYAFTFLLAPLGPRVLILVYTCMLCERLGLRQIAQTLPTEIFPAVVRHVGISLSYLIRSLYSKLMDLSHPKDKEGWREIVAHSSAIGFLLGIILVFLFMPETKDLPLTDTEELGKLVMFPPRRTRLEPDWENEEESMSEE